jgi:hypothetical protein
VHTLEDCVAAAVAVLSPEVMSMFPLDPLQTMRSELSLKVRRAEHLTEKRSDGGACDGLSFLKDGVILYAPTRHSRRENFTLAHEVGHWLISQVPEIYDWLFDQRDSKRMLETLCDRIAQRLLLSESAIAAVVGAGPLRARHVVDLYQSSQASMPACAIALAARLPGAGAGAGAVIMVEQDFETDEVVVRYASVRPDPNHGWPKVYPWPNQVVPAGHPLKFLAAGAEVQRRTFWTTPWGERADFYMDASALKDGRAVAVLADTDLWGAERFHPETRRDYDQRPEQDIACCGQIRTARGYPCQNCDQVHCPTCGKCRCDRQTAELVTCSGGCFLSYRPNLLVNGLCEACR